MATSDPLFSIGDRFDLPYHYVHDDDDQERFTPKGTEARIVRVKPWGPGGAWSYAFVCDSNHATGWFEEADLVKLAVRRD